MMLAKEQVLFITLRENIGEWTDEHYHFRSRFKVSTATSFGMGRKKST